MADNVDLPGLEQAAQSRAQELLDILKLDQIETNLYMGKNETRGTARLFGGQVLAQAAMAASMTVEEVQLHSLHSYFLKAGDPGRPVLYEVERIRDGRSFTTRRVVAVQAGEAIFNMDVSFQIEEPGFEHAHPMPNVPMPDELPGDVAVAQTLPEGSVGPMAKIARPFEMRHVFTLGSEAWLQERYFNPIWLRFPVSLDEQPTALHRCLLAYASDMGMVATASLPHSDNATRSALQMASLDHALWMHRSFRADDWLLFAKRTSAAQGARGMVHAEFFTRAGKLVASVTQEGLLRVRQR